MEKALTALLTNIANLFKVKTIISIVVIVAMTVGFLTGLVPVEVYAPLATAVMTYFFTRKDVK